MSTGEFRAPTVNTAIRLATPDGGEFVCIIDVDPDAVRDEHERVGARGLMMLEDLRGHHVWTVWTTTITGFDAVEAQPDPLPNRP